MAARLQNMRKKYRNSDDIGRLGRDINLTVVVGVGLWRGLALEIGDHRRGGILILPPSSL
jgi:hypothetical protein